MQKGIYDQFAQAFAAKVKAFKVGNGFASGVTHGPLVHDRAIDKVDSHVRDAEQKGGRVIVGGQKLPDLGPNFYQPTVITGLTTEMAIASEETFGPVAGLFPFETEEEVVKVANATPVGLAGYFFSKDLQRVYRVAEALDVGMVGVNTGLISDPASPFGGVKESGFGREGSKYGCDEYLVSSEHRSLPFQLRKSHLLTSHSRSRKWSHLEAWASRCKAKYEATRCMIIFYFCFAILFSIRKVVCKARSAHPDKSINRINEEHSKMNNPYLLYSTNNVGQKGRELEANGGCLLIILIKL